MATHYTYCHRFYICLLCPLAVVEDINNKAPEGNFICKFKIKCVNKSTSELVKCFGLGFFWLDDTIDPYHIVKMKLMCSWFPDNNYFSPPP